MTVSPPRIAIVPTHESRSIQRSVRHNDPHVESGGWSIQELANEAAATAHSATARAQNARARPLIGLFALKWGA